MSKHSTSVPPGTQLSFAANGISIPSSYTAHLAPLSSSKLHQEARSTKSEKSLETPYVVMFQAVNILSGTKLPDPDDRCGPQVQECWEFEHPRKDVVVNAQGEFHARARCMGLHSKANLGLPFTNSHNARSANLRFYIPHAGILQSVDLPSYDYQGSYFLDSVDLLDILRLYYTTTSG